MQGWVKFHRQIVNWEWYTDANTFRVFTHLLLMANHKDGKWRGNEVKRGQFITSYRKLGLALDLSQQQVRTALDKLEPSEITRHTTNKYTLINVVNYEFYQGVEYENNKQNNVQDNTRITDNQQTDNTQDNTQITTNKNDKKLKNEKNDNNNTPAKAGPEIDKNHKKKFNPRTDDYTEEFLKAYDMYPKPGGKRQGMINFYKLLKDHSYEDLITAIKNYTEYCNILKTERKYIIKFSNFFGEKSSYEDYLKNEYVKPKGKANKNSFHDMQSGKDYTEEELNKQLGIK